MKILYLSLLSIKFCCSTNSTELNDKNIVLIFADDVGIGDIPGFCDDPPVPLPNIDELRKHGISFKNFHATPWCAPSRYSLLSGNYQFRGTSPLGQFRAGTKSAFPNGEETVAQLLQKNGYNTAMFGKWHLGGKYPQKVEESKRKSCTQSNRLTCKANKQENTNSCTQANRLTCKAYDWTKPFQYGPQDIGFGTSEISIGGIQAPPYAYLVNGSLAVSQEDIVFYDPGEYERPKGISEITKPGDGDKTWDSSNYNMKILQDNEIFLDSHLENNPASPFFSFLSLGAIHGPATPPDIFIDGTPVKNTQRYKHLDMVYELDLIVGYIVSGLRKRNLLNKTLLIFLSDNGGVNANGNLRGRKGTIWEGGNTVPLIMRYGNKFPGGASRNQLAGITDLYATIAEFAGIAVSENQAKDSKSLLKCVHDPAKNIRKNFLVFNYDRIGTRENYYDEYGQQQSLEQSLRSYRYKVVYNTKNNFIGMFDLVNDPSETKEICVENLKMCKKLFSDLVREGPCQQIEAGW
eukprot:CAMPEP_0194284320 /NCGR_PEP_ID=MMETSP0169-20130528/27322_1 /TAXON_ID=218684 /ORGANISM="Corethron pennatum, Strain L29A3" /LENGTH=518 /DNA_ID=CAMNT_0039030103 /DNA_START=387 /DNA_END=1940 /DNA_ORIENTATION=-